jgi:hypothetical protein
LRLLRDAWSDFHTYKDIFISEGGRKLPHFNIPKIHKTAHYLDAIVRFGACDGYNTEATECLHIDLAKQGYRASNRRDYVPQMARWLERQEAVRWHESFIQWTLTKTPLPAAEAPITKDNDDDEVAIAA